ncbi:undecaprenyl-phosphate glucose phosphotransferase [Candidatus Latescibacterota bacterium]
MKVITRHYEPALITLFRLGDALLAGLVFYLMSFSVQPRGVYGIEVAVIIFLLTMVVFPYTGVYRTWRYPSITDEIKTIAWSCFIVFVLFFLFINFIYYLQYTPLLYWITIWFVILFLERVFIRIFLRYRHLDGRKTKRAIIIGMGTAAEKLTLWINENPWSGTQIEGIFNNTQNTGNEVLGSYEDVSEYVRQHSIDSVFIALPSNHTNIMKWLLDELADSTASVYLVPDIYLTDFIQSANIIYIGSMPVLSLIDTPFGGLNMIIKKAEDIVFASLFLVLCSPLLIIISILIKTTTGGPVLFKQWRYGLDGKPFLVWKFKTMTVSEDGYEFNQAINNDTRITYIGKILRKYYLDELPQFINVLIGNMSIVGPRPHAISMVEEYRKELYGSILRHKIKPGVTGLAQLYGAHGEIDSIELTKTRIKYDIEYLNKWSIWLDLRIMLLTMIFIFKGNKEKRSVFSILLHHFHEVAMRQVQIPGSWTILKYAAFSIITIVIFTMVSEAYDIQQAVTWVNL